MSKSKKEIGRRTTAALAAIKESLGGRHENRREVGMKITKIFVVVTMIGLFWLGGATHSLAASEVAIIKCVLYDDGIKVVRTSVSSSNVPIPIITNTSPPASERPFCAPTIKTLLDAGYQMIQAQVDSSTGGSWYTLVKTL